MIKNKDFNNSSSSNILEIPLNLEPTDDNHAANKPYVDSLSENNKNLRDLFTVFNDQDTEFDEKNIKKLDSLTSNRNPILDNELSNNKYVDDSLGESTILRFKNPYQTISKLLSELMFLTLVNLIEYKLRIQHFSNIQIKDDFDYNNGH